MGKKKVLSSPSLRTIHTRKYIHRQGRHTLTPSSYSSAFSSHRLATTVLERHSVYVCLLSEKAGASGFQESEQQNWWITFLRLHTDCNWLERERERRRDRKTDWGVSVSRCKGIKGITLELLCGWTLQA